jgi:serine protease Do
MKKFYVPILSAIIASAITIGAFMIIKPAKTETVRVEHVESVPAVGAAYTVSQQGEIIPLEFSDVAENAMEAVVHIKSTQIKETTRRYGSDPFRELYEDEFFKHFFGPQFRYESPQQKRGPETRVGAGSGVIISNDGYVVTNNHVIDKADDIEVTLHNNGTYKAEVVGTDPSTDLALLKIEGENLPTVPFYNSDDVRVGEWVLAVGNPFNLNSTVTAGIVSAKARNINILRDKSAIESFIQTDAAINPGNSGGALLNLKGSIIGINTAIASPTGAYAGYGFAVPSNIVSKVVEDLMNYGVVQRGYIGVMIRNVNSELSQENNLDVTTGVYIDSVMKNSAAAESGLKVGDVVTRISGIDIETAPQLQEIVGRHRPGDEIEVTVNRKGKIKTFMVTLKNKEGQNSLVEKEEASVTSILGAAFEEIDKKTAKKLNIDGGVKISELKNGKLKKHTDIKEGFIITKIDNQPINSVEDIAKALENKKGGVMIEGVYENYPGVYYYAFGI